MPYHSEISRLILQIFTQINGFSTVHHLEEPILIFDELMVVEAHDRITILGKEKGTWYVISKNSMLHDLRSTLFHRYAH